MSSSARIIVSGLIAQYPLGGVTWDYGQFVQGLAQLGHEVHYIEDTGQWPYNPAEVGLGKSCDFNVAYLRDVMARYGLEERWAYRFAWQGEWFGMSDRRRRACVAEADILLNVSGTLRDPGAYRRIPRLVFLDSDPVFTQLKLARGQGDFRRVVDLHDLHFSFGERLGAGVPETGHRWRPTRQPVVLSEWSPDGGHRGVFTTVMTWKSYNPVEFEGRSYGQKDVEFERFVDLPSRVAPTVLELAVSSGKARRVPRDLLAHKGWRVVDPAEVCPDMDAYRSYVQTSKGEWSVAKNGYVEGRPGWFSCRSACYLAAGRPVVVEDTGFSSVIPTGRGVLAFTSLEEAAEAIRTVEDDYQTHSRAAREIAEERFDSRRVLGRLVEEVMAA